jgi:hypothetical protein
MASKIPRLKNGYIYIKVGSDCKTSKHLKSPKNANFTKTPLKKIEKLVEASTCALGNQP